jgi:branched-chain amino acid transport system permease protein
MQELLNQYGFLIIQMTFAALMGLSMYFPLMAGQLSLASPGFYALGGYIAAILSTQQWTVPRGTLFPIELILLEMLIAGAVSGVLAVIIGVPSLRLRGIYLALATIAFVEVMRVVPQNLEITGKAVGIFGIPQPFPSRTEFFGLQLNQQLMYGVIAFPMLFLVSLLLYRLERSRVGRAFAALREDELAAAAMGVNPTYYKVLAFVLGAVLAGMVGAVSAHFINTWNPRQGVFDRSIEYLAFVIIGGSRTFLGPIMGGLLLTALPEALRAVAGIQSLPSGLSQLLAESRFIIYGLLIAIGATFFPQGLISPNLFKRRSGRKADRA